MEEPTSMAQAASFPVHITQGQNIVLRPSEVYNGLSGLSSRTPSCASRESEWKHKSKKMLETYGYDWSFYYPNASRSSNIKTRKNDEYLATRRTAVVSPENSTYIIAETMRKAFRCISIPRAAALPTSDHTFFRHFASP